MEITTFLAQVWGPITLAIGIGMFTSRSHYLKVYRDLEKETLAVLCFGVLGMMLGIIQVSIHNVWDTFAQGVVSLLGWALLIKATLFIVAPRWVNQSAEWAADMKIVPLASALMLLCGAYLTWLGYFV